MLTREQIDKQAEAGWMMIAGDMVHETGNPSIVAVVRRQEFIDDETAFGDLEHLPAAVMGWGFGPDADMSILGCTSLCCATHNVVAAAFLEHASVWDARSSMMATLMHEGFGVKLVWFTSADDSDSWLVAFDDGGMDDAERAELQAIVNRDVYELEVVTLEGRASHGEPIDWDKAIVEDREWDVIGLTHALGWALATAEHAAGR